MLNSSAIQITYFMDLFVTNGFLQRDSVLVDLWMSTLITLYMICDYIRHLPFKPTSISYSFTDLYLTDEIMQRASLFINFSMILYVYEFCIKNQCL